MTVTALAFLFALLLRIASVPVPCCFPTCNSVTYAFVEGDQVTPLPRIVNVNDYLDYITNRIVPDFDLEIKAALEGLWSSSSPGSLCRRILTASCGGGGIAADLTAARPVLVL